MSKQTKDLLFDIKISVKASPEYIDRLKAMKPVEFQNHVSKACFKNNDRYLYDAKILNCGFQKDLKEFKKVLMPQ